MNSMKQYFLNGPTVLVIAAGIAIGIGFAPHFVNAQETQSLTLTSPLDGGERHNNRRGRGTINARTFLAEELGITAEALTEAWHTAREAVEQPGELQAELAAALGITEEALQSAQDSAREAALAQAVEDGRITQEEADLKEAESALRETIERTEVIADALDVPVEELEAALDAGTSIRDIASDLGIDGDTLRTEVEAAYEVAVQQAVEDGVISQDQADAILADDQGNQRGNRRGEGPGNRRANGPVNGPDNGPDQDETEDGTETDTEENSTDNNGTDGENDDEETTTAVNAGAPSPVIVNTSTTEGNESDEGDGTVNSATENPAPQDDGPGQRGNRQNRRQGNANGGNGTENTSNDDTGGDTNNNDSSGNESSNDNESGGTVTVNQEESPRQRGNNEGGRRNRNGR
ncbi:MAG: hypothetical protein AAF702_11050 [Chloroflexota bacterium]